MKSFYTSVNRYGNSILYRGYNENGAAIAQRYKFSPTLYTPSKKPTKFKGFDSGYVAPLNFPTMRDAKEWLEQYQEMEGVNIFGTKNYIHQVCQHADIYVSDTKISWSYWSSVSRFRYST